VGWQQGTACYQPCVTSICADKRFQTAATETHIFGHRRSTNIIRRFFVIFGAAMQLSQEALLSRTISARHAVGY